MITRQSSNDWFAPWFVPGGASHATDGNYEGEFYADRDIYGSYAQTWWGDNNWLSVDLGRKIKLARVRLYNRHTMYNTKLYGCK